jgi:hypothetical protein
MLRSTLKRFHHAALTESMIIAFIRFPLAAATAAILAALSFMGVHTDFAGTSITFGIIFCLILFLFSTISGLFSEGHNLDRKQRIIADGAAIVLTLALTFPLWGDFGLPHVFILSAGIIALLFAPYVRRASSEDSVWYFNYLNISTVLVAGVSVIIIGAGFSAVFATIDYLFGLELPRWIYADVWILASCFFFPLFILSNLPRQFDWPSQECATPRGVKFIANYILVPLMLIYTAVLYAYFARIAVTMELPRGQLGILVAAFGVIGIITHLACYVMRRDGNIAMRFFYRHFYKIMIIPLALMALGLWTRISDYGVTEERYTAVLCLIWLGSLGIWHLLHPKTIHIKYIPMIAASLLLIAAIGPWGAKEVSLRSQTDRLVILLQDAGVIKNGQSQKTEKNVDFATLQSISSILDFLSERKQLHRLIEFTDLSEKDIAQAEESTCQDEFMSDCDGAMASQYVIMSGWGLRYVSRWEQRDEDAEENDEPFSLQPVQGSFGNSLLQLEQHDFLADLNIYTYQMGKISPLVDGQTGTDTNFSYILTDDGRLTLLQNSTDKKIVFDLKDLVRNAAKLKLKNLTPEQMQKLKMENKTDHIHASLQIIRIQGTLKADGSLKLQSLQGKLLFSVK